MASRAEFMRSCGEMFSHEGFSFESRKELLHTISDFKKLDRWYVTCCSMCAIITWRVADGQLSSAALNTCMCFSMLKPNLLLLSSSSGYQVIGFSQPCSRSREQHFQALAQNYLIRQKITILTSHHVLNFESERPERMLCNVWVAFLFAAASST